MSPGDAAAPRDGTGEEWRANLEEYDVRFVVLDVQRDRGWQQVMCREPDWVIDTEDEETVLYARVAGEGFSHV